MNVYIYESNLEENQLEKFLRSHYNDIVKSIFLFNNLKDLKQAIKGNPLNCDLIFIDLGKGKEDAINVIEVGKEILKYNRNIQFIFTTWQYQYYLELYEVDHIYYLIKPFYKGKLNSAMKKAVKKYKEILQNVSMQIPVKSSRETVFLETQDIIYIRKDRRLVEVCTESEIFSSYGKLKDYEVLLNPSFIRCHNSYIVNIRHVARIKGQIIYLNNGEIITASRAYGKFLKEYIEKMTDSEEEFHKKP